MQNLIPFDLKRALAGEPLVTRDGRKVTSFSINCDHDYPYRARINEDSLIFTSAGSYYDDGRKNEFDLFMAAPAKTLLNSAIKPVNDNETCELRGMYRQAGFDVSGMGATGGLLHFVVGGKLVFLWAAPDNYTVYDSLADYLNDKPRPKDVRIPFGSGQFGPCFATLSRDKVKINGLSYTIEEVLKLAETIKKHI